MDNEKAIEQLRDALQEILPEKRYSELFFRDLYDLWQKMGISPEVVLREIEALEGLTTPLMQLDSGGDIPIWFATGAPIEDRIDKETGIFMPDTYMKMSASATKDATQFTSEESPLKGLWHKHYFVNEGDILSKNILNENKKFKKSLKGGVILNPTLALALRTAESALTGEWILFAEKDNVKNYICLAKHDDGDDVIFKRIIDAGIHL